MNGYMEIIFDGIFEFVEPKLIQVHEYGHFYIRFDVFQQLIKTITLIDLLIDYLIDSDRYL